MGIRNGLLLLLLSCTPPASVAKPDAAVNGPPPAAPVASVTQVGACPMTIDPGRALGPVRLGQRASELGATGLPLGKTSQYDQTQFTEVGPIHTRACGGIVVEAWLDDLRAAPDCVQYAGKAVDRAQPKSAFEALFPGCKPLPPRIGGSFVECAGGGLRIGTGMGEFIQVRVTRPGSNIDDECADVMDDGKAITLDPADLGKLLQRTLDIDSLAPFWHSTKPGRDPLRILKAAPVAAAPPLSMFGSPVIWVEPDKVKAAGGPVFEFTKIDAPARRVTISFRYPVEGVVGTVRFQRSGEEWRLVEKNVGER